jgi:hypothetical protein
MPIFSFLPKLSSSFTFSVTPLKYNACILLTVVVMLNYIQFVTRKFLLS